MLILFNHFNFIRYNPLWNNQPIHLIVDWALGKFDYETLAALRRKQREAARRNVRGIRDELWGLWSRL